MLLDLVNKILIILLFMSILNVVRHAYYFIQAWVKSDSERPEKYRLSNNSLWVLATSIAYILTTIFNGVLIA